MASHADESVLHTVWEFLPGILKAFSVIAIIVVLFQAVAIFGSRNDGYEFAKGFIRDYSVKVGKEDSNVKLVYFYDFQCPGCKANDPVITEIREKYKDRVEFVYRNFPLTSSHTFALPAAQAGQAVALQGVDKYFKFKEEVFAIQNEISTDNIANAAKKAGVDFEKWDKDRVSTEIIKQVDWDRRDANSYIAPDSTGKMSPLAGTPTAVILKDGVAVEAFGSLSIAEFEAKINKYLQ
jgi:protein-disulfide isomerase